MKTLKPFALDKATFTQKITLVDNDKIVKNDDLARVLNTCFSNIVSDLKVPDYNNCNPLAENIQEPVLKTIVKDGNHPSIGEVKEKYAKRIPTFLLGFLIKMNFRRGFKFRCIKSL